MNRLPKVRPSGLLKWLKRLKNSRWASKKADDSRQFSFSEVLCNFCHLFRQIPRHRQQSRPHVSPPKLKAFFPFRRMMQFHRQEKKSLSAKKKLRFKFSNFFSSPPRSGLFHLSLSLVAPQISRKICQITSWICWKRWLPIKGLLSMLMIRWRRTAQSHFLREQCCNNSLHKFDIELETAILYTKEERRTNEQKKNM